MLKNKKDIRRFKIHQRIRNRLSGTDTIPRLSVYKSNRAVYAQLIDDVAGNTLLSVSSRSLSLVGRSISVAGKVGEEVGKQALERGIKRVVFDRSGYIYHGRIKMLADSARSQGLQF